MNPIIVRVSTAWEASGLSLAAFSDLVGGLVASGRAVRHRDVIVFPNLKTAALVLTGRTRARRKGKR